MKAAVKLFILGFIITIVGGYLILFHGGDLMDKIDLVGIYYPYGEDVVTYDNTFNSDIDTINIDLEYYDVEYEQLNSLSGNQIKIVVYSQKYVDELVAGVNINYSEEDKSISIDTNFKEFEMDTLQFNDDNKVGHIDIIEYFIKDYLGNLGSKETKKIYISLSDEFFDPNLTVKIYYSNDVSEEDFMMKVSNE